MKEIILSQSVGLVALVDDEDWEWGRLAPAGIYPGMAQDLPQGAGSARDRVGEPASCCEFTGNSLRLER
jgi:hypothetical protein